MPYIDKELIGKTIADITEGYELVPATHGTGVVNMMTLRIVFADGTSAILTLEGETRDSYPAIRMEKK